VQRSRDARRSDAALVRWPLVGGALAAVSSLDDPVRRRLYNYVAACGEPVGRDQAAAATGNSRSLTAYHLDKLVSLGLLTASYRRIAGRGGPGAGRPAKIYARSTAEFAVTLPPREYELAARLLARAVDADPSGAALAGLRHAAREHGTALGRAAQAERAAEAERTGREQRADRAADRVRMTETTLAAHGFEPVAEAGGALSVRNCPFHRLAVRNPGVVCAMNLALIEGIVAGIGADEHLRPELNPAPDRCCVLIRADASQSPEPIGES
jgi:predicted ArsR family transcriptional regulator